MYSNPKCQKMVEKILLYLFEYSTMVYIINMAILKNA